MPQASFASRLSDRIIGARIVAVTPYDDEHVCVEFEHKGTDDDSGCLIVGLTAVRFDGEEDE